MEQILALCSENSTSSYIGNFASCDEKVDQTEDCLNSITLHYMIDYLLKMIIFIKWTDLKNVCYVIKRY